MGRSRVQVEGFGGEWPEAGLDVSAAVASGWVPSPIQQYVLKLSSRCNLACDYCYVYKAVDQSWRSQPLVMSAPTLNQVASRLAEHATRHRLGQVEVVLHGGEPLLVGSDFLGQVARVLRAALPYSTALNMVIQTNGTLLDDGFLKLAHEHGIRIGISLDGDRDQHDRHRRRPDGRGSHESTERALDLLARPENRAVFGGILCTVDLANDPLAVFAELNRFRPPVIDFLLPHGTWSAPPPGHRTSRVTPYADWLGVIFDRWFSSASPVAPVRLFEEVVVLLLGGSGRSDQVGLAPATFVVVETDGALQQTDSLKVAYPGAPATGMTVWNSPIDALLQHPAVVARQLGLAALSDTCRSCAIVEVCGGGHYAHRYRAGHGFRNPSVYCADLFQFIEHVRGRVLAAVRL